MAETGITRRGLLGAGAAACGALRGAAGRRPNIVLILLDDLGTGDFGCYGQRLIRTPNTDRAAAEGSRFTDCYAGGVVCAPSRSTLMTGLHTGHTPIRANAGTAPIAASDVTVAQVLKQAGYATGGFGKWGLGDAKTDGVPTKHGFDRFFGYLHQVHAHSYYPEFLWDNDSKYMLPGNAGGKRGTYSADLIAERSFEFLREHRNGPFFLYCCYTLPHAKFEIPSVAPYEKESWTDGQKTYAAMVTRADGHIGRILGMLREFGIERDTAVFICSDNGAHSGEDKGYELFRSNGSLREGSSVRGRHPGADDRAVAGAGETRDGERFSVGVLRLHADAGGHRGSESARGARRRFRAAGD
jgi:arylsulfatase A-like enzyme